MKKPASQVRADHYAQIQMQMLVSGCKQAYLVNFSVTKPSFIIRVPFDEQWCEAAVELVSYVWAQSKSDDGFNVIAFTTKATPFWKLTKSKLNKLNDKESLNSKQVPSSRNETKNTLFQ